MTEEPKEKALNLPPAERQKMSKILSSLTPEQIQYSVKWLADQNHLKRNVEFERHYEAIEKYLSLLAKATVSTQSSIEAQNKELLKDVDKKMNDLELVVKDRTSRLSNSFEKIENIDKHMKDSQNTIEKLTSKIHDFMHDKVTVATWGLFFVIGAIFQYFMNTVLYNFSVKIGFASYWFHFTWILILGFCLGMSLKFYLQRISRY